MLRTHTCFVTTVYLAVQFKRIFYFLKSYCLTTSFIRYLFFTGDAGQWTMGVFLLKCFSSSHWNPVLVKREGKKRQKKQTHTFENPWYFSSHPICSITTRVNMLMISWYRKIRSPRRWESALYCFKTIFPPLCLFHLCAGALRHSAGPH